jgi:hypothetical protein
VVTDPAKRAAIGALYKKVYYQEHAPNSGAGDPGMPGYQQRSETIVDSARYSRSLGRGARAHHPVRRESV